jgi:hypothetical protein
MINNEQKQVTPLTAEEAREKERVAGARSHKSIATMRSTCESTVPALLELVLERQLTSATTVLNPERLIHWSGTPKGVCERKDSGADAYYPVTQPNAGGVVGSTGMAYYPSNVTCPTCKAEADKGCNRHRDCKAADEAWRAKTGRTFIPANFHCYDEDCEDCFGR